MSYSIEEINGCTKKLVFNIEQMDLSTEIKTALLEKQKSASLKGFRKGKAPFKVIEKMYGPEIENRALSQFIQGKFFEALEKEEIKAIGHPMFANTKYEPGSSVSFEVTVETFPKLELKDYSSLSFTKSDTKVDESEVEELKKNYLSSKAEVVEVTDESATLQNGFIGVINFEGEKADGEKPENMKGSEYLLEVGSNSFIPGFEEGLVGMKAGEKKTLSLTFPEEYHEPSLRNAEVKFHVELLEIKEKKLPEFDDAFAKEVGYESVEDFKEKNLKNLSKRKEAEAEAELQKQILEKLIEQNPFDLPNTLIVNQESHVKKDLEGNLKRQGFTDQMVQEYFEKWKGDIVAKAEFQVRSGLILDEIAKANNVEVDDADFKKKLDDMVVDSGLPKEQIEEFYSSNSDAKKNMMYALREEKTFKAIIEKVSLN